MSQQQIEIDQELEELVRDLNQRPVSMSDSEIKVPDTMEFGEFMEEFGGDTFVEVFHGLATE